MTAGALLLCTAHVFGSSGGEPKGDKNLNILNSYHEIIRSSHSEDTVIKYSHLLLSHSSNLPHYQFQALLHLGQAYKNKGEYEASLGYLLEALKYPDQPDSNLRASVLLLLGSVYGRLGDVLKMEAFFKEGISQSAPGSMEYLIACNNLAEGYYHNEHYDSAFKYYEIAYQEAITQNPNGRSDFSSFILGNLGMVNIKLGYLDEAEHQLTEAIAFSERINDLGSTLTFQLHLADVFALQGTPERAVSLLLNCIRQAKNHALPEQIRDGYKRLSHVYESQGSSDAAFNAFKLHIAYRDSIQNLEVVRKIGDLRTEFEVGQKQAEVDLLNIEKRNQQFMLLGVTGFSVVLLALAFIIFKYYQSKSKLSQELAAQKAELERLNHTKDKFFSIISHDLRGPVSSFHGISRMIKYLVQAKATEELLEVADEIDHSVDRLSALLDNLLTWAMQQQGGIPHTPEKIHLNELARDLMATMENMAKSKLVTLETHLPEEMYLWADRNTTMTALRNLINNAIKFTSEGGTVSFSANAAENWARIVIKDTGVGIPEEKLRRLFQFQEKKSTYGTSGEKGLGLGLQLVYEFIAMNGGIISVESQEGKGTSFVVELPLFSTDEKVGQEVAETSGVAAV